MKRSRAKLPSTRVDDFSCSWSLLRSMERLPTSAQHFAMEEEAVAKLIVERWPSGVCCLRCGSERASHLPRTQDNRFKCYACLRQFSIRTDSAMHGSHSPLWLWIAAFGRRDEVLAAATDADAARLLGYPSRRRCIARLRRRMRDWPHASVFGQPRPLPPRVPSGAAMDRMMGAAP